MKSKYVKYLDLIKKNKINKITDKEEELLKLFSFALYATHENYKYNETYMLDFIDEFKCILKEYVDLKGSVDLFCKELKKHKYKFNIQFIISNMFFIEYKNNILKCQHYEKGDWKHIVSRKIIVRMNISYGKNNIFDSLEIEKSVGLNILINKIDKWQDLI